MLIATLLSIFFFFFFFFCSSSCVLFLFCSDFWIRYFTFSPSQRHHYELIVERAPCHLYFDVEFKRKYNPQLRCTAAAAAASADAAAAGRGDELDGENPAAPLEAAVDVESVMSALCAELVSVLNERFGGAAALGARVDQILQLDSSSAVKFSRHLIVRLSGPSIATATVEPTHPHKKRTGSAGVGAHPASSSSASQAQASPPVPRFMFRDNAHAGRFVRYFCQHISKLVLQARVQSQAQRQQGSENPEAEAGSDPAEPAPLDSAAAAEAKERRERVRLLQYIMVRESDEDVPTAPAVSSCAAAAPHSADKDSSASAAPSLPPAPAPGGIQLTSMIDQSVYTRNRSFRCFLSSKMGRVPAALPDPHGPDSDEAGSGAMEAAPTLLVADANRYPLAGRQLKDTFMDSLVCNVGPHKTAAAESSAAGSRHAHRVPVLILVF